MRVNPVLAELHYGKQGTLHCYEAIPASDGGIYSHFGRTALSLYLGVTVHLVLDPLF